MRIGGFTRGASRAMNRRGTRARTRCYGTSCSTPRLTFFIKRANNILKAYIVRIVPEHYTPPYPHPTNNMNEVNQ